jgi:hypothetical protein
MYFGQIEYDMGLFLIPEPDQLPGDLLIFQKGPGIGPHYLFPVCSRSLIQPVIVPQSRLVQQLIDHPASLTAK